MHDSDLGVIIVKPNKRARHVIARRKTDHISLTVPYRMSRQNILNAIESLKPRLLKIAPKQLPAITEDTNLRTFSFSVQIKRFHLTKSYRITLKNQLLTIFIPETEDILSPVAQERIRNLIEQALRFEAKRILPQKTEFYARKHGLKYQQVKINKSRTRWGSCSRRKNINFSLYLLLLNEKQIDYVVLHELAHTVEMNHSPRFWELLSTLFGEDAKAFSRTMKKIESESYAYFAH